AAYRQAVRLRGVPAREKEYDLMPLPRHKTGHTGAVELTAEQRAAAAHLLSFPAPVQTLGGYAGAGKTTVVKHLKEELPGFAVCASTGKAAHVLRKKGVPASTIHSLIYKPVSASGWAGFTPQQMTAWSASNASWTSTARASFSRCAAS